MILGFKVNGANVRMAKNDIINNLSNISIGDNDIKYAFRLRIVKEIGYLNLGSFVHKGTYSHFLAADGIEISDFSELFQRERDYSKTDRYSGKMVSQSLKSHSSKYFMGQ